ncbi:Prefoldin subunit 6 [Micractinium conductrix]|uniref:Prefoldin subunit 6 n=1 Tax=Micractinium conductrix TaxID=554055 RepID=A0A2P6UZM2_9CHLO|nr:Prefoldin subunit 6 [Micractinium conductrix]|eukprot:PSC67292.1 Prefoldin subunit 6 [Micractinium conductrix]
MEATKGQALHRELQSEVEAFRQMQADVQNNHRVRQQMLQQKHENEMVLQEIKLLDPEAAVYKMIGPALVRQDGNEAQANVGKRLEFIGGELKRLDSQLAQLEDKQSKKQAQLVKLQTELQRIQQAAQPAGAAGMAAA